MREVEYFRWWVTAPGRKRPYLTSFPMTAEDAAKCYTSARPEISTRELRSLPETAEERGTAMFHYQAAGHDSVRPPARQNASMKSALPTAPGPYLYTDPIGGPPQKILVRDDAGQLVAFFEGLEGDEGAEIPIADMSGTFQRG